MPRITARSFSPHAAARLALQGLGAASLLLLTGCYVEPAPGPVVAAPPPPVYYAPAYAPAYAYPYPPYRYYGGGGYYGGGPAVGVGIRVR